MLKQAHVTVANEYFLKVVDWNDFICFRQSYQLIVKADNTTRTAFHVGNIVEFLESRDVLFVWFGVLFYFYRVKSYAIFY